MMEIYGGTSVFLKKKCIPYEATYIGRPGEVLLFTHRAEIYKSQTRDIGIPSADILPNNGAETYYQQGGE